MATRLGDVEKEIGQGIKLSGTRWRCDCGEIFVSIQGHGIRRECQACVDKANREQMAIAEREGAEKRDRLTAESIPDRYRWATFESDALTRRVPSREAIAGATRGAAGSALVLLGSAGSGKTSLAAAALRAMARRLDAVGRFVTAFDIAKARQEHRLGEGEAPAIEKALQARVLVLDELGAELGRNTAVQEVIHERHSRERPTIYTTGFSKSELEGRYGAGIARRIFEDAMRLGAVVRCGQ